MLELVQKLERRFSYLDRAIPEQTHTVLTEAAISGFCRQFKCDRAEALRYLVPALAESRLPIEQQFERMTARHMQETGCTREQAVRALVAAAPELAHIAR
jgi:hypothetical protein